MQLFSAALWYLNRVVGEKEWREEERTTALVVKARNEEKRRNFKPLDFF